MPVGKTQQAAWLSSRQEQEALQTRFDQLGKILTPTTQHNYRYTPNMVVQIQVPQSADAPYWLSLQAASASARRQAQVWLEYLWWLAYVNDDSSSASFERIVVFSNKTLQFSGVTSSEARDYLNA